MTPIDTNPSADRAKSLCEFVSVCALHAVENTAQSGPSEATWDQLCDDMERCLRNGIAPGVLNHVASLVEGWSAEQRERLPKSWRAQLVWGKRPWMLGPAHAAEKHLSSASIPADLVRELGDFVYWNGTFDMGADHLTPQVLARSVSHEILVERRNGSAMLHPPELPFANVPKDLEFVARIDLSELPSNVAGGSQQIVWLFGDEHGHDHSARVGTDESAAGSFVWERRTGEIQTLRFQPRWTLHIDGLETSHIELLPATLLADVSATLGCPFKLEGRFDTAIGGRPATRRGEFFYFDGYFYEIQPDPAEIDPRWYEEFAVPYLMAPASFENARFDEMMRVERFTQEWNVEPFHRVISRMLLFQQDLSNDDFYHYRHWWVDRDDLRRGTLTEESFSSTRAFGE